MRQRLLNQRPWLDTAHDGRWEAAVPRLPSKEALARSRQEREEAERKQAEAAPSIGVCVCVTPLSPVKHTCVMTLACTRTQTSALRLHK